MQRTKRGKALEVKGQGQAGRENGMEDTPALFLEPVLLFRRQNFLQRLYFLLVQVDFCQMGSLEVAGEGLQRIEDRWKVLAAHPATRWNLKLLHRTATM